MPPRINIEGCYTDEGTVDQNGNVLPYTREEYDRTKAHEEAAKLPSTLGDADVEGDADVITVPTTDPADETDDEDDGGAE